MSLDYTYANYGADYYLRQPNDPFNNKISLLIE
jgi:hypothetical protein